MRTRTFLWAGAPVRIGGHRLPQWMMSGKLENAERRARGGEEKEWTDCMTDDIQMLEIRDDWKAGASEPSRWYSMGSERTSRVTIAWRNT